MYIYMYKNVVFTLSPCQLLLLGQADKALEETEWMMARMKGALSTTTEDAGKLPQTIETF